MFGDNTYRNVYIDIKPRNVYIDMLKEMWPYFSFKMFFFNLFNFILFLNFT